MRLVKLSKEEQVLAKLGYKMVHNTRKDKGIVRKKPSAKKGIPLTKKHRNAISKAMKKNYANRLAI